MVSHELRSPLAAMISVHNLGEPIPVEVLPYLFEPFRRGGDAHGAHPGRPHLGIGLFVAFEVVQAHGGTIVVTSAPGSAGFDQFMQSPEDAELVHRMNGSDPGRADPCSSTVLTVPDAIEENVPLMPV